MDNKNIYASLYSKLGRRVDNSFHRDVIEETNHFDARTFMGMLNVFVLFNITRPRKLLNHTNMKDDIMYELNLESLYHSLIPIFRNLYATNINSIALLQLRTLGLIIEEKARDHQSIDSKYVVDAWIEMYETRVSPIAEKQIVVSILKKAYDKTHYLIFHWIWFHAAAAILRARSDPTVTSSLLQFFQHYSAMLECEMCASHFDDTIAKHPKHYAESIEEYFIRIHGIVRQNDILSFIGFACPDRDVPVADIVATYRNLFTVSADNPHIFR